MGYAVMAKRINTSDSTDCMTYDMRKLRGLSAAPAFNKFMSDWLQKE